MQFVKVMSAFALGLLLLLTGDVQRVGANPIEGYASATSVAQGQTIDFHVRCEPASMFSIQFIRVGKELTPVKFVSGLTASDYHIPPDAYAVGCGWPV